MGSQNSTHPSKILIFQVIHLKKFVNEVRCLDRATADLQHLVLHILNFCAWKYAESYPYFSAQQKSYSLIIPCTWLPCFVYLMIYWEKQTDGVVSFATTTLVVAKEEVSFFCCMSTDLVRAKGHSIKTQRNSQFSSGCGVNTTTDSFHEI